MPCHGTENGVSRETHYYSIFIPPALLGQMTCSVLNSPTYSTSLGWTFKTHPAMNLSLLLFTKVGNDNNLKGLKNFLWEELQEV